VQKWFENAMFHPADSCFRCYQVIIACNHSGGDLYRYSTSCKAYSAEFLLRCAYSSANFEYLLGALRNVLKWFKVAIPTTDGW
jgi:hypothetical protein